MIAAIAADGILALLPALSNMKQASLYAAAGFISYYSIYAASDQRWLEAVAGACMVLLFYAGKRTFSNESLMTLFCAVVLPLLCWSLL
ncbi:hypothetical protein [Paenibacillus pini]|uniref:Uncharacterized protein n=1 Tax=Paenibacillus pini JCM 16418 TaxID=1236976 RepID=W7Z541_9BACL|nr:hypothetical protein [Paenibacillus pini]GAF09449.1 hypothetical protein JCM16418_3590 [Paenibacillus pini JCM 16418]